MKNHSSKFFSSVLWITCRVEDQVSFNLQYNYRNEEMNEIHVCLPQRLVPPPFRVRSIILALLFGKQEIVMLNSLQVSRKTNKWSLWLFHGIFDCCYRLCHFLSDTVNFLSIYLSSPWNCSSKWRDFTAHFNRLF